MKGRTQDKLGFGKNVLLAAMGTGLLVVLLVLGIDARPLRAQSPDTALSPVARTYLDRVLDIMEQNALHKSSVDWLIVRREALAQAGNAQTTFDTYPAIAFALTQLQEHHSWFQLPDTLTAQRRDSITAAMAIIMGKPGTNSVASPFLPQKEMLGHIDRVGGKAFAHVVVPMCIPQYSDWARNGPYFAEFAEKLHRIVVDLQSQNPDGWIVDLRGNGGGNMWPMVAGIGAVLGEGDLGFFVSADRERVPWFYKSGKVGTRSPEGKEEISAEITEQPFQLPGPPWVAVLFDRGTASSGEAVAVSFAGRSRERSFGEHTAGFSTSNQRYALSDGASLFLCVGVEADRTGRLYPDGLEPDTSIAQPKVRPAEENDATLRAAEAWLMQTTIQR